MDVVWSNEKKGSRPLADDEGSYLSSEETIVSEPEIVDDATDNEQTVRGLGKAATPPELHTYPTGYTEKHPSRVGDVDMNFSD